jgi:prepilin-type processing-associated H-X9-DG protein
LDVPAVYPLLTTNGLKTEDSLSYGWNAMGTGINGLPRQDLDLGPRWTGTKMVVIADSQVVAPANLIAICDNEIGTHDNCLVAPNDIDWEDVWRPGSRHETGANLTFCDGHVEHHRLSEITDKSDQARKRWNNDDQSHRETW